MPAILPALIRSVRGRRAAGAGELCAPIFQVADDGTALTTVSRAIPGRNSATSAQAVLPGVATWSRAAAGAGARPWQEPAPGEFDVGCVIGVRAVSDIVFAGLGKDVELMRSGAANRAGVGGNRAELFRPSRVKMRL